jgi:WD40 repeat protein
VAFSPDGRKIATSSANGTATIWDAGTGDELVGLIGHADWVQAGAFSPDGNRIATTCRAPHINLTERPTVKIWDTAAGRELLTIERGKPDESYISRLAFSPDGRRIALAAQNRTPRVWDASTGRELLALRGHVAGVLCIDFSPDGRRIVTASLDRSAKVWDAQTGRELLTLEGHTQAVTAAAFLPNGRSIATTGNDGTVKIWEAASPEQVLAWQNEAQTKGRPASLTPD